MAGVVGKLQGFLSTVAYAMGSGRVVLVDWTELYQTADGRGAFESLGLQSDFSTIAPLFQVQPNSRRARNAVQADEAGVNWLCGIDVPAVFVPLLLSALIQFNLMSITHSTLCLFI